MEEKKKGGKRPGAGRKKSTNPSEPFTFYVKRNNILKFGSPEKFKKKVEEFIEKADLETEIQYSPTTPESFDSSKLSKYIQDEPPMFSAIEITFNEATDKIMAATSSYELEEIWRKVSKKKDWAVWQLKQLTHIKETQRTKIDF